MENQTQKLLQSIIENARTGLDACEQMISKTKDAALRDELMTQRTEYQKFAQDAERALYAAGGQPHAKGMMSRAGMWMGIEMNTLMDASTSHIAELLIQGSTMGVVGMTRDQGNLPDASAEAQGMATAFIQCQQQAIDRLKKLLTSTGSRV